MSADNNNQYHQYQEGQLVQVLFEMDDAPLWINAKVIKIYYDHSIKVEYLDQVPGSHVPTNIIEAIDVESKLRLDPDLNRDVNVDTNDANTNNDDGDDGDNKEPERVQTYEIGQKLTVKYQNELYTVRIAEIDSNGMKIIYDVDNQYEILIPSQYEYRIQSEEIQIDDEKKTDPEATLEPVNKNKSKHGRKKSKEWNEKAMIEWTNKDFKGWIESMSSYKKYASSFPKNMDGKELLDTTIDDLALIIPKKLWRRKFMKQLELAKEKYNKSDITADGVADDENNNNNQFNSCKNNGVVGLYNLGNTCYMNTSIQILSQTPYITRYLKKRAKISTNKAEVATNGAWEVCKKYTGYNYVMGVDNENNFDCSMLNAWTELCDIIYNKNKSNKYSSYSSYTTASPAKIRKALNGIDSEFGSGRQDDSARSLEYMLQALDEQIEHEIMQKKQSSKSNKLNKIKYKDNIQIFHGKILSKKEENDTINELLRDHNPNNSVLRKSFDGIERVIYQCLECNGIFQQYATFRILDLPVISHAIQFENITIITKDDYYKLPAISMLDYCSIDILKYHVIQHLLKTANEKIMYNDIQIVVIKDNGQLQFINTGKLSEIQALNGCIFILINDNESKERCNLLQFVLSVNGNKMKQLSAKYIKYDPNKLHELIDKNCNDYNHDDDDDDDDDNDDKKYDYHISYNGNVLPQKQIKPSHFKQNMHQISGINMLILLRVSQENEQYSYNISDIDQWEIFEATQQFTNCSSILDALKKLRTCWSNRSNAKSEMNKMPDPQALQNRIKLKLIKINNTIDVMRKQQYILQNINNWLCKKYKTSSSNTRKLTDLIDCLSEYQRTKILDHTAHFYPCSNCKTDSSSSSLWVKIEKKVVYSPPIFLFHLDRFGKNMKRDYQTSYQKGQKIKVKYGNKFYNARIEKIDANGMQIKYDIDNDIKQIKSSQYGYKIKSHSKSSNGWRYSSNKFDHAINYQLQLNDNCECINSSSTKIYNLYGVSNHSGTTDGGHYTATIKCLSDGNWYDISDSHVTDKYIKPLNHANSATILAYARDQ